MGIPCSLGLNYLSRVYNNQLSWAWVMNGCFSVIGAVVATVFVVEFGVIIVMLSAAATYGISVITSSQNLLPVNKPIAAHF